MHINLENRDKILGALVVIIFTSFTISYAINNIAVFLLMAYFFFDKWGNIKQKIISLFKDKLVLIYILFFAFQLIGVLYSQDKENALRRVEVMLPILFVPAILSVEPLSSKTLKQVLGFIKYAIPLTFLGLLIYHIFFLQRTINTFVNFTITEVIGVSQFYLAFILLFPILECLRQIIFGQKVWIHVGILSFNLIIVFLLGNKTTLFFLLILGIFLSFKMFKKNKKRGILLAFILFGSIVFASQLPIVKNRTNVFLKTTDFNFEVIKTKNNYTITKNTLEHRVLIDYISLKAILNGLPFGYGTGDYLNELYQGYEAMKFKAGIHYKYNAHNQYLSEFLKTGLLGGLCFIILILLLIKHVHWNHYHSFIILLFAVGCLVESYLFRQHGVVIFAFMIPLIIYNTKKLKLI